MVKKANVNENYKISPSICQDRHDQNKQTMTSVGEEVKKLKPLCTVGGNVTQYSCYENQYGASSELKDLPYDPNDPTFRYLCKKTEIITFKRDIGTLSIVEYKKLNVTQQNPTTLSSYQLNSNPLQPFNPRQSWLYFLL